MLQSLVTDSSVPLKQSVHKTQHHNMNQGLCCTHGDVFSFIFFLLKIAPVDQESRQALTISEKTRPF